MEQIRQKAELAPGQKDGATILANLERCGRISHKSEACGTPESAEAFIRKLIKWGHESVLEHESVTLHIVTDRGISHELVRHRIGTAFTQESTRYVDYVEGIAVIRPAWDGDRGVWERAMDVADQAYCELRKAGWPAEAARAVLPTCVKTELYMTANIREWRHILRVRQHPAAHPQMRALAGQVKAVLYDLIPVCFEDL